MQSSYDQWSESERSIHASDATKRKRKSFVQLLLLIAHASWIPRTSVTVLSLLGGVIGTAAMVWDERATCWPCGYWILTVRLAVWYEPLRWITCLWVACTWKRVCVDYVSGIYVLLLCIFFVGGMTATTTAITTVITTVMARMEILLGNSEGGRWRQWQLTSMLLVMIMMADDAKINPTCRRCRYMIIRKAMLKSIWKNSIFNQFFCERFRSRT